MTATSPLPEPSAAPAPDDSGAFVLSRRNALIAGLSAAALAGITACSSSEATRPAAAEQDLDEQAQADDVLPSETQDARPVPGPPVITGSFVSAKMLGRPTRWAVARPNGVNGKLPVVVVLHALNTNERSIFGRKLQMQNVLQSYVDEGNPPFALAAVDGAENYWHRRVTGADAGAMVLDEFLPMLASNPELNLSTERIGLHGWSMGGYGALRLGALVGAPRVAAISVSSPALWADPHNFPPRAFDSFEDYQANSLFGQQKAFAKIPLMITIGTSDQFFTYTRQWAADLHPPAAFAATAGGHGNRYWRSVLPDHVMFLGRNLTR
ncbi:putative esterase [Gordonia araii NBRC 100433]|uniref:Acyl-CoA:diacylglycerol acyltransferase n=1 Tax=Gordonia araii NBRC 100433 TaxID=1073574 RepID=G7H737_9ACTN|nr:alpha/beta hydrolase-fold protein [Gordonia araii]NNG97658.1 alpha/beta hydrolase [Gordonia araii NBRC 100433]GAB11662.1 putative esterase [Gordonia araii NBRC 100433]